MSAGRYPSWLPRAAWRDLSTAEALDFGLEQVGRWTWQMFEIEWFGVGLSLWARARVKT